MYQKFGVTWIIYELSSLGEQNEEMEMHGVWLYL